MSSTPTPDLIKKAEASADKHYDRRNPAWRTAYDHYIEGATEALGMAAEMAERSGHGAYVAGPIRSLLPSPKDSTNG